MIGHFALWMVFIAMTVHSTISQQVVTDQEVGSNSDNKTLLEMINKLHSDAADLQEKIADTQEEQEDMKGHVLNQLVGMRTKLEWCLVDDNQGLQQSVLQAQKSIQATLAAMQKKQDAFESQLVPPHASCQAALSWQFQQSGIYTVSPDDHHRFHVFCEQELAGGGWTVIQRRIDGTVDFYRGWSDYKNGFGNLEAEHWIGNEHLYQLTKQHDQQLKIRLEHPDGHVAWANYTHFSVGNETENYTLTISGFTGGEAGDSLTYHNQMAFSTHDRDNDQSTKRHCAQKYKGSWWYRSCHWSNLNALFGGTGYSGLSWSSWVSGLSLKTTLMMIKERP